MLLLPMPCTRTSTVLAAAAAMIMGGLQPIAVVAPFSVRFGPVIGMLKIAAGVAIATLAVVVSSTDAAVSTMVPGSAIVQLPLLPWLALQHCC